MESSIIGNKIAKARKGINISQAQLAQRLFISPQAVGKWERGESIPDLPTLNRLAAILGVDLNYFSENFPSGEAEKATGRSTGVAAPSREPEQAIADQPTPEPSLLMNFNGSNLPNSDFAGIVAHKRKFHGSALRGSDFSGADLTGSSFNASDVREANFDGANLTDCTLSASDLSDTHFDKSILVRTEFSKSALTRAKFAAAKLTEAKLTKTDLRKTVFENCVFDGVDFADSDMRGLCLDGQTFMNVRFHNTALGDATFNGAILTNVSFRAPYAITNKYYRSIKTIRFDGATMDKLTYAFLKGMGADLSKVTVK
ncbi:pentapeptide repeat-containing protein [Puia sp.]|jgi:uncharacterized protein YjbI with pentapeptide repeats/DNA-binding XRE family transcriptional regulator|uniref:pentapeptide repeat-containing protein n=1 Tax=Puia sp. TaxID=2045100 RepID=UPI002F4292B5